MRKKRILMQHKYPSTTTLLRCAVTPLFDLAPRFQVSRWLCRLLVSFGRHVLFFHRFVILNFELLIARVIGKSCFCDMVPHCQVSRCPVPRFQRPRFKVFKFTYIIHPYSFSLTYEVLIPPILPTDSMTFLSNPTEQVGCWTVNIQRARQLAPIR